MKIKRHILCILAAILATVAGAQSSDSVFVQKMRDVGVTFSHNNSVTLLTSGQEKFDDMFAAIRQAKSSVHLEYFNFRDDSIANALFDILAEKAGQGVEVRALHDAFGNASNNQPLRKKQIEYQRSRGIQIYEYDPLRFPWITRIFHRDHRKIVIIDGEIAYTGGMNVADYYIHGTEVVGSWHDMHCRLQGDEVRTLQDIFIRIWNKVTDEELTDGKYYGAGTTFADLKPDTTATAGHKMVGIVNREPVVTNKIMRQFYINALDCAKDSVKLLNPYFTLVGSVRRAINRAIDRGVKVELMIAKISDIPLTPDCAFYNMHKFMKRGADVWINEDGFHHTKIIMVDGKYCTVGSCNLDARSLRWDYEANAVIIDKNTTAELSRHFDRNKSNSFYLTEEKWDEWRTPWQKFRGRIGRLIAFWL